MKSCPLVYIILVNYNGKEHTIECIKSLSQINYENYKIIVIDNNSTDGCIDELKESFEEVIVIKNNDNLGFAKANNIGIKYAMDNSGEYVLLLNNDTIVEKDFLDQLIKPFMEHKINKIGLTIGKIRYYDDKSLLWYAGGRINYFKANSQVYGLNETDIGQYDEEKEVEFATGCCMLISKDTLDRVGYLSDEYFLYYEDTDYSCKIINSGLKMIYVPKSIIYHKESVATNKFSYNYQYYFARNRLLFIKNNMKFKSKITGYPITILWLVKKIILDKFQFKPCFDGIRDFLRGKYYKR